MSIWTNVVGYIEIPKKDHVSLKESIPDWFDGVVINTIKKHEFPEGPSTEAIWRYYIEFVYPKGNVESLEHLYDFLNTFPRIRYDIDVTVRLMN